jgi:hypothetical protein
VVALETKVRWFEEGADNFARAAIGTPFEVSLSDDRRYMCPLCRLLFSREALVTKILTGEHVPPDFFGGRELVLTCTPCNNDDGSDLDARAEELERMVAVLRGSPSAVARIKVHIGENILRGSIENQKLTLPKKINSPDAIKAVAGNWDGGQWGFDKRKDADAGARCSWIRAGYLVLFAALGYRVVLDPAFDSVRAQIDRWKESIIGQVFAEEADGTPDSFRLVARMKETTLGEFWMVQFGRLRLIYPDFGDVTFYDRVAQVDPARRPEGLVLGWPHEPFRPLGEVID